MIPTNTTTHRPASDLGVMLLENPATVRSSIMLRSTRWSLTLHIIDIAGGAPCARDERGRLTCRSYHACGRTRLLRDEGDTSELDLWAFGNSSHLRVFRYKTVGSCARNKPKGRANPVQGRRYSRCIGPSRNLYFCSRGSEFVPSYRGLDAPATGTRPPAATLCSAPSIDCKGHDRRQVRLVVNHTSYPRRNWQRKLSAKSLVLLATMILVLSGALIFNSFHKKTPLPAKAKKYPEVISVVELCYPEYVGKTAQFMLTRDPNGLFYIGAVVNGSDIRFMIDTGSTLTVLSSIDALRAGVELNRASAAGRVLTASGEVAMTNVILKDMTVAGRHFTKVHAIVVSNSAGVSVLGQNMLRRLKSVSIEGDVLVVSTGKVAGAGKRGACDPYKKLAVSARVTAPR